MMHHRVPGQIHILGKAAPQMRHPLRRRIAIADCIGIGAPIGVFAMPILPGMAPLAFAAAHIVLDEDEIAFLESLAAGEFAAGLGDSADIFVPHDHRGVRRRMLVELDVGAADAADFHFHQRGVLRNVRHGKFAQFGPAGADPHRRYYLLRHGRFLSPQGRTFRPSTSPLLQLYKDVDAWDKPSLADCKCSGSRGQMSTIAPRWTACASGPARALSSPQTRPSWSRRSPVVCQAARRSKPMWCSGAMPAGTISRSSSR